LFLELTELKNIRFDGILTLVMYSGNFFLSISELFFLFVRQLLWQFEF